MDPELRGLGETEFSVCEADCSRVPTPGPEFVEPVSGQEAIQARLRIPPPPSFCTETFPLSQSPTPFPLRSFEAFYDGSLKLFQEHPARFFENERAESEPPKVIPPSATVNLCRFSKRMQEKDWPKTPPLSIASVWVRNRFLTSACAPKTQRRSTPMRSVRSRSWIRPTKISLPALPMKTI